MTITQPDQEEYSVLVDELTKAKSYRASLTLSRAFEGVAGPFGAGGHATLLSYLVKGQKDRIEGRRLAAEIEVTDHRIRVVQDLIDDYTTREQVWNETQKIPMAEDPPQ